MNLENLDKQLAQIQQNKIVTSFDDLFVVNNIRATINSIQAISSTIESNPKNDNYKAKLVKIFNNFQNEYICCVRAKLADMGIDFDANLNESNESVEDDYVKPASKAKKTKSAPKIRSLREVMKEISSASKNFRNRKNSTVSVELQQGKAFTGKKDENFLKVQPSAGFSARQNSQTQNASPARPAQNSAQTAQPSLNKPIFDQNVQQSQTTSQGGFAGFGGDEDYLNLGGKNQTEQTSVGREFLINLINKNKQKNG